MTAPTPPGRQFASSLRHSNRAYLRQTDHAPGPRQVAFVLLEHFSMMAFTSAVDALVTANLLSRAELYRCRTFSVDGGGVASDLGIQITVDAPLEALVPEDLDQLILCGGFRTPLVVPPRLRARLREAARQPGLILGGLWNGSYLLARAGLLDGYACTVHPENRAGLEESCPQVDLQPSPYVIDRDRASCAGASSALGMMLELLRRQQGAELVRGIEELLSCDRVGEVPERPMPSLVASPLLPPTLQAVLELMESNIEEPLALDELARYVGRSRRQIDRLFQRHLGTTPSRYYLELRITRARRLLLQTNQPITSVAVACGFVCATHFSHCYREFFGVSPRQARQASLAHGRR